MTKRLSIVLPLIGLLFVAVWVTVSARKVEHVGPLANPPVSTLRSRDRGDRHCGGV